EAVMRHTRAEVIKRASQEFRALDRLVAKLTPAQWKKRVPRPESKDPWTVKDALAHITYWKVGVALSARGRRRPPEESRLKITALNRLVYGRWRSRTGKDVLAWHRQVHRDLLAALREAPTAWFTRPSRSKDWPFDLDGHSAEHRVQDIESALKPRS
ncbi:MAG TPA: maleylpyruvate isomerase N-terminal domain-containing protein, partial [Anaerolineales bacterium]|nr:maleylpyruvate isomerase N-terminal domain-containing protein [Anaerolineales bacterium]